MPQRQRGSREFAIEASGLSKDRMSCCSTVSRPRNSSANPSATNRTPWRRDSRRLSARISSELRYLTCRLLRSRSCRPCRSRGHGLLGCRRPSVAAWPDQPPPNDLKHRHGCASDSDSKLSVPAVPGTLPVAAARPAPTGRGIVALARLQAAGGTGLPAGAERCGPRRARRPRTAAFVAHRPTDADRPRRVAFVDGTLRTEARLTRTGPDGDVSMGLAGSWAAGAVFVDGDEPARFDQVTTGRAAIFTGGRPVRLPDHRRRSGASAAPAPEGASTSTRRGRAAQVRRLDAANRPPSRRRVVLSHLSP